MLFLSVVGVVDLCIYYLVLFCGVGDIVLVSLVLVVRGRSVWFEV